MNLKIKKISIIIFLILFLADNCLYLVSANMQAYAKELCWILCLGLFAFQIVMTKRNIFDKHKFFFGGVVLFLFVLALTSTLEAMRLHGQSFIQGILPQRFIIGAFCLYFVLENRMNRDNTFAATIERIYCFLAYSELFLYITQYLLINNILFLSAEVSTRLGGVRLNLGAMAVPYLTFTYADRVFCEKNFKMKNIAVLVLCLFYSLGIGKTRIALVAYMFSFIAGLLITKGTNKKILSFILVGMFAIYMVQTDIFAYLIDGLNGLDLSSQTRVLGREYYISKIIQHPLLGAGYINTNNANAVAYAGINSLKIGIIAWVDLGIYGLTFFFGILGLIWFLWLYGRLTYTSFKIGKRGNLVFWMYMIFLITISPNNTGFIWYINDAVPLIIMMSLLEYEYKKSDVN